MSNSVLWYTTRGAGAVSLILLTCVVVLGVLSALRVQSQSWPRFLTTGLHSNLALMTLVFLSLHIVTAVVDPFTNLGWAAAFIPLTLTTGPSGSAWGSSRSSCSWRSSPRASCGASSDVGAGGRSTG